MKTLVELISTGKLKEPEHEIITVAAGQSDEDATKSLRYILTKMAEGQYGKKVLLRLEGE
jgi:trans-2-enoyl-CoA reductase